MTISQTLLERVLSRPFKYLDQVNSTNDTAKAWLAAGAPEGAVVIAGAQTRGRGRHGRSWHTPPDAALALSLILKPPEAFLPRLNMVAALSVYDLARKCGCKNVAIKWPNDILVDGKKASGVLTETVWEGGDSVGAIVGIGVNVRIDFEGSALSVTAISLEDVVERRLDRVQLTEFLLSRFDYWYRRIATPTVFREWRARLVTLNQTIAIDEVKGVAFDVTAEGALLIRDANGRVHQAQAGDPVVMTEERVR
ncbi:MAG: biotin--[acetyl-CoA-carboxylase] ligase [Chloroflexi bacterium]|nr:biotin--[acetyl-CoA-carboxylase] ligase [Chloroflexota bacterium]